MSTKVNKIVKVCYSVLIVILVAFLVYCIIIDSKETDRVNEQELAESVETEEVELLEDETYAEVDDVTAVHPILIGSTGE